MTDRLFALDPVVATPDTTPSRGAVISPDGLYRYRLWRAWRPELPRLVFIMLNPSTADAEVDDPTIRRCMGFAKREGGFGGIEVINLYALRATKPAHLLDHPDPNGPTNVAYWHAMLGGKRPEQVVAAWGAHVHGLDQRGVFSWAMSSSAGMPRNGWRCLGVTKAGHPRHPLYLPAESPLVRWEGS